MTNFKKDHNRLSKINCGIYFCTELTGLWIGYNHIRKISRKLVEGQALNILDIEHNKVFDLPQNVKRRKLLRIICHGNFFPHSQYRYEPEYENDQNYNQDSSIDLNEPCEFIKI